ncbi:MAG: hypothetical protein ACRBK7_01600 [Acidimicrobiales bacterium]
MAKNVLELDTPFRKGEKVIATRDLGPILGGTQGKIQLQNGLSNWIRYWVLFDGGRQVGQIDHNDLVRPNQLQQWTDRKEAQELAALQSESAAAESASAEVSAGGAGGGIASQIPAHLLERSKAAKARLLG